MNKNRMWVIGATLAMVVILTGGWVLGIAPQLATAANANRDRLSVVAANTRNQMVLSKLKRDYEHIDALINQFLTLQNAVPPAANISSFVTELNTLAGAHKVTLNSITVSDARPYSPITQTAPTKTSSAGSPQTNSKITSDNFVTIPVQISVTGDYGNVLNFVDDVQSGQRLILVSTLSTSGSTDSKATKTASSGGSQKVDSSIGGYIYVLLNNE
jgi:Tfp pilus assembly protein PilO